MNNFFPFSIGVSNLLKENRALYNENSEAAELVHVNGLMANRCSGQMLVVSQIRADYRLPRLAPRPVSWNGADKRSLILSRGNVPFASSSSIVFFFFFLPFFVFVLVFARTDRAPIYSRMPRSRGRLAKVTLIRYFTPGSRRPLRDDYEKIWRETLEIRDKMQCIETNFKIKDKEQSEIFRMLSDWRWRGR